MTTQLILNYSLLIPVVLLVVMFVDFVYADMTAYSTETPTENPVDITEIFYDYPVYFSIPETTESLKEEANREIEYTLKSLDETLRELYVDSPVEPTIRELKKQASEWNKENPDRKIKKWDRMTKEELMTVLSSL